MVIRTARGAERRRRMKRQQRVIGAVLLLTSLIAVMAVMVSHLWIL